MALDRLTAIFAHNPLGYLRGTTISPPAADAVYRRNDPVGLEERSLRFFSRSGQVESRLGQLHDRFRSAQVEMPIGWIKLQADRIWHHAMTFDVEFAAPKHNPTDYTDVSQDFQNRVDRADRLPVFYLPWQPDHLVRMTIPRYRTENATDFGRGVSLDPYCPHIFFTAALSGCSVFVYGDPRQPTVVHVGTKTATPYGDDSALFWRELLLVERFQRLHHQGMAHEVNLEDYMENNASLRRFRDWVARQPRDFDVKLTVPFGAVFGIRYGALWSFYLQENTAVFRCRIRRVQRQVKVEKPGFLPFTKTTTTELREFEVEGKEETTTIPLAVRPFFPAGGGQVQLWDTFQKSYV